MSWPPSVDDATAWREVSLDGRSTVRIRQVRLWGDDVWIDASGMVLCDGCAEFHTPQELLADRSHPVSPSFAASTPNYYGPDAGPSAPSFGGDAA